MTSGKVAFTTLCRHFRDGVVVVPFGELMASIVYAITSFIAMLSTLVVSSFRLWILLTTR